MRTRIHHPELGVFVSTHIGQEDKETVDSLLASVAAGRNTYLSFSDEDGNKHFFSEEILKNSIISLIGYDKT